MQVSSLSYPANGAQQQQQPPPPPQYPPNDGKQPPPYPPYGTQPPPYPYPPYGAQPQAGGVMMVHQQQQPMVISQPLSGGASIILIIIAVGTLTSSNLLLDSIRKISVLKKLQLLMKVSHTIRICMCLRSAVADRVPDQRHRPGGAHSRDHRRDQPEQVFAHQRDRDRRRVHRHRHRLLGHARRYVGPEGGAREQVLPDAQDSVLLGHIHYRQQLYAVPLQRLQLRLEHVFGGPVHVHCELDVRR